MRRQGSDHTKIQKAIEAMKTSATTPKVTPTTPARRQANTKAKVRNDGAPRMPHERDEAPDDQSIAPRKDMKQAYDDLQNGQVDTDLRNTPGVDSVMSPPAETRPPRKKLKPDGT